MITTNKAEGQFKTTEQMACDNELVARGYIVFVGKTYRGEIDFLLGRKELMLT